MATLKIEGLHKLISDVMEEETKAIVEEEAKEAAARVEKRIRALAGEVATRITSLVRYETRMNELVITVMLPDRERRFEDLPPPPRTF